MPRLNATGRLGTRACRWGEFPCNLQRQINGIQNQRAKRTMEINQHLAEVKRLEGEIDELDRRWIQKSRDLCEALQNKHKSKNRTYPTTP